MDVSECCHTCDWYDSVPVGKTDQHGRVTEAHDKWDCSIKHLLKVFRDWGAILEGVQTATESGRNEIAARLDVIAEDAMTVAEVAKVAAIKSGVSVQPMIGVVRHRIGGAIKQESEQ
jgi:hypothetical protein